MRGEGAGIAAPEAAFELGPGDGGGIGRGHRQGGLHCVGGMARVETGGGGSYREEQERFGVAEAGVGA